MSRIVLALTLVLIAAAGVPLPASGASWRWPVEGDVVAHFSAGDAEPFAAGRRRGIAIAAGGRAPVRAACAGTVAFAGPVGRAGLTVSVGCGRLRATYQGLAAAAVRRGQRVAAGAAIGTLGRAGILRLGARREPRSGLHRYVDPLTLLRRQPPALGPLGPAPRGRVERPRWRPPRAVGMSARPAATAPVPAGLPLVGWIGLGLLALAVPPGALVRRRRREQRSRVAPALRA